MLKEYAGAVRAVVMAADLTVVAAAFLIAHWLRGEVLPALGWLARPLHPLGSYLPLLPVALLLWGLLLWRSGAYRSHRTVPLWREFLNLARVTALGGILLVLVVYLLRLDRALVEGDAISRLWMVLFALLTFCGLAAERGVLRGAARLSRSRGYNYRTVLILGTSDTALAMADAIRRYRFWGYEMLGFLSETRHEVGDEILGAPVLGTVEDLDDLLVEEPVDEVICALGTRDEERDRRLLLGLLEVGIRVRFALGPVSHPALGPELAEVDGVPLVTYTTAPRWQAQLLVKRFVDLLVAGFLLLLFSPLLALIALLIRLDSKGPVLFRQRRVGLNGRRFEVLKFRTMIMGAHKRRAELDHLNEMDGPVFKIRRDPRVTRVGRLLRRMSLDELPQLWNVVRGEMSLVGPRPMIDSEVRRLERWQRRRLSMRPGITCLWQVEGRNALGWDRWVELDMAYIDGWSPWLDLKILLRTIPAVLSGRGAS